MRHPAIPTTHILYSRPYAHTSSIFATPSVILRSSGSVGLSLVMWLLGAVVAACGTAVYIELGTVRSPVTLLHREYASHHESP